MEEEKQQKKQRFHCSECKGKSMTEGAWRVHKSRYKCKEKEVCTGRDCPTCKAKGKCCYKSPIVTNRQLLQIANH